MRGGGGPHTRGKSTAPSRIERVAKDPMRRAKKRVDLAHPRRRWKPSSSACARGSVRARDEFSCPLVSFAHAISWYINHGLHKSSWGDQAVMSPSYGTMREKEHRSKFGLAKGNRARKCAPLRAIKQVSRKTRPVELAHAAALAHLREF